MADINYGHGRYRNPNKAHGPTVSSWRSMHARCYSDKTANYENYGGRGIIVCPRWFDNYANFLADMGERPIGTSIDRIDPDGNYAPENCRWATKIEQANNRRDNHWIEHAGERLTRKQWASRFGISDQNFGYWLKKLSVMEAVEYLTQRKDDQMGTFSIDDMARAGRSSPRAIRHWEDKGLLGAVERTDGEHRRYTAAQVKLARIIAAAQFGNFTLEDTKAMLEAYDAEAQQAIIYRLSAQIDLAVKLLEELPAPPTPMVYDL